MNTGHHLLNTYFVYRLARTSVKEKGVRWRFKEPKVFIRFGFASDCGMLFGSYWH